MMEQTQQQEELNDILERAKLCQNKGRYYVYESFKTEICELNLSPREYEQACRKLADYLKV